jgi:hypothetical protein
MQFDFVQRMLVEYEDLQDKLVKLGAFINSDKFKELDDENRSLLNAQYHTMYTYKVILSRRIKINGGN